MLVSELAERADVPLATVKYYLREGLLAPGETTGPRRSEYDASHLRRLRILRALREVGGAPVSALQVIVDAVEDDSRPEHDLVCEISDALSPPLPVDGPDQAAGHQVNAAIDGVGWSDVRMDAAARLRLADLVQLVSEELLTVDSEILGYYARLADHLCRTETAHLDNTSGRPSTQTALSCAESAIGGDRALPRAATPRGRRLWG